MSKLFVNGCSITLGAELGETTKRNPDGSTFQDVDFEYRTAHRWSTVIKDILGMDEVVNLARGGGSNWRTWRTTLDWFDTNDDPDVAIIQLSGTDRFQIPINEKYFAAHYDMPDWENWVAGGRYCSENDVYPVEEYSHWAPRQNVVLGLQDGPHKQDVEAHLKFNSPIFQALDNMRLIETMISFFRARNIPCYIWDGLTTLPTIKAVLFCLKEIESGQGNTIVGNIIEALSDPEWFYDFDKKENYYSFLTLAKVYDKVYNKWQKLQSMPELSMRNFSDLFISEKHPDFVGKMPGYHPDEKCHREIANHLYFEMRGKGIWNH